LRELLGRIPWLSHVKVERNPADFDRVFDLRARFHAPRGPEIELLVDYQMEPRPSQFPYVAIEREFERGATKRVRVGVFAAPHISPRMAEICESHGWSWFDLAGNCRISVPELFHLEHKGNSPVHHRRKPVANLSTPEAGRVIRALLAPENAGLRWTQREMQKECDPNVSLGLVNKVVRYLREEAFIEVKEDNGFRLRDPLKLLFAWREAYRFERHERRGYFTLLQGTMLRDALSRVGSQTGGYAVYAAFSAAEFQAPHVRQPKTWLYVRETEVAKFERLVDAKRVESGENLVVLIPEDDGVFSLRDGGAMGDHRMSCTNAVQTYVDLWHCGGRGEEAAEAMLEQRLKPEWRARGYKV
jgi:hypothetical protein